MILDKNDLTILPALARDCRTSYSSIGSQIGLTSKSVKARVKKMVRSEVIEKFVVRVNPAAFGYRTAIVLIRTSNGITKDDVIQRVKEFGDLAYHAHHVGSTSVAALIIKKPLNEKIIQSLNDHLKPATIFSEITMPQLLQIISPHSGSVIAVLSLLQVEHVVTVFFSSIFISTFIFTTTS